MYIQCSKHTTSSRFLIWVSGLLGFGEKSIAFGDDLWYTYCLVCLANLRVSEGVGGSRSKLVGSRSSLVLFAALD